MIGSTPASSWSVPPFYIQQETMASEEDDDEEKQQEEEIEVARKENEFPDAFYDPITKKIMVDPVVNLSGDSYDQTTIDNMSDSQQDTNYYPNRALKSIIERETELASNSMRAGLRRFDEKLKDGWGKLVEKSAFAIDHHPLPPSYYCPIMCELMVDPVITPEGFSYERDAIENWITVNRCSPMTRNEMSVSQLRENNALYELIQEEKDRTEESLHPSIRRWKESGPTSRRPVELQHPAPSAPPGEADTAPGVNVSGTENLPTTNADIRRRRFRRSARNLTLLSVVLAALVVLGAVPVLIAVWIIALVSIVFCFS